MSAKNIVLCFDGTWNTAKDSKDPAEDDSTNVVRFYDSVKATPSPDKEQVCEYFKGVGTDWYDRFRGGAFGLGLDKHIVDGYRKLIELYQDGDAIYLVGFSRGAYTARSLVGLIRNSGLLKQPSDALIDQAYGLYRSREGVDSEHSIAFRRDNSREIPVKFVGVWDTVGALGVPVRSFEKFNAEQYSFHDTRLSSIVQNAFHALALDEHRRPYKATLWDAQDFKAKASGQVLEQVWFSGAHADVGGGYTGVHPVADLTLRWMQQKAKQCGLVVDPIAAPAEDALCAAELHDSFRHFIGGLFSFFETRYYRPVAADADGPQLVDASVKVRLDKRNDYRPKNEVLFKLLQGAQG